MSAISVCFYFPTHKSRELVHFRAQALLHFQAFTFFMKLQQWLCRFVFVILKYPFPCMFPCIIHTLYLYIFKHQYITRHFIIRPFIIYEAFYYYFCYSNTRTNLISHLQISPVFCIFWACIWVSYISKNNKNSWCFCSQMTCATAMCSSISFVHY